MEQTVAHFTPSPPPVTLLFDTQIHPSRVFQGERGELTTSSLRLLVLLLCTEGQEKEWLTKLIAEGGGGGGEEDELKIQFECTI